MWASWSARTLGVPIPRGVPAMKRYADRENPHSGSTGTMETPASTQGQMASENPVAETRPRGARFGVGRMGATLALGALLLAGSLLGTGVRAQWFSTAAVE